MQPTLVGTIIQQNFSGVQELAQKLGYPVPQNPQEGYNFFVALRDKTTQQDFARYVMSVHPNWQLFGKNICNTMLQNNSQPMQYRNACCGFVNADGSQNGNGQNSNGQNSNGQNGNGQATSAGGILDRFLGTNPRSAPAPQSAPQNGNPMGTQRNNYPPATGTPGGQLPPPGASNTWYGNDILPSAPLPGAPRPIPNQPAPGVPSGIPVLPPLPF